MDELQRENAEGWTRLGWPWIPMQVTAGCLSRPVAPRDAVQLAFWAGLHAAVMAAVCESCMGPVREAVRSYSRERRFDEAGVL